MHRLSLFAACVLIAISLCGKRARLAALGLSSFFIFPAFMPMALRSAIYVPELLIAVLLLPWIISRKHHDILGAPSWFGGQLFLVVVWTTFVTFLAYCSMGLYSQIPYRIPMASLRMGAVILSFAIPASMALSREEFTRIVKILQIAFCALAIIAIVDYTRLIPIRFFFQVREATTTILGTGSQDVVYKEGGANRASLGQLCILGISICILLMQLRSRRRMLLSISLLVGLLFVLLLSESRSAYLGIAAFALAIITIQKGSRLRNILIVLIALGALMIFVKNVEVIGERYRTLTEVGGGGIEGFMISGRVIGWGAVIRYLASHPFIALIGVGFDCWGRRLAPYCGLYNGHNILLQTLGELGLIGFVLYMGFFLRLMLFFGRSRKLGQETKVIGGLALCLMVGLFTLGMTTITWYPEITRMNTAHTQMFFLGLVTARLRYVVAEHNLLQQDTMYLDSNLDR